MEPDYIKEAIDFRKRHKLEPIKPFDVLIYHHDEVGEKLYSVAMVDSNYWVVSFINKKDAITFIKKNKDVLILKGENDHE